MITVGADDYDAPERTLQFAVSDAEAMRTVLSKLDGYEVEAVSLTSGPDPRDAARDKGGDPRGAGALGGTHADAGGLGGGCRSRSPGQGHAGRPGHRLHSQATATHRRTGPSTCSARTRGRRTSRCRRHWPNSISSEEASEWLRPIDAGNMALIIVARHSAASVDQPGFKPGPRGDRGLGQLAYDKAMRILAASQADDVALESARLKHGLLTYALAVDGLAVGANGKRSADLDGDGRLTLAELPLRYGEEHTPALYEDIRTRQKAPVFVGRNGVIDPNNFRQRTAEHAQTPQLFDFAKPTQADAVIQ